MSTSELVIVNWVWLSTAAIVAPVRLKPEPAVAPVLPVDTMPVMDTTKPGRKPCCAEVVYVMVVPLAVAPVIVEVAVAAACTMRPLDPGLLGRKVAVRPVSHDIGSLFWKLKPVPGLET